MLHIIALKNVSTRTSIEKKTEFCDKKSFGEKTKGKNFFDENNLFI